MTKKWTYDEDDEPRLFYGDEDFNGSAYPCNDSVFMEIIANKLNELDEENKQLKQELDNIYLLIGRGDWSGLVDYLMNNESEVKYSIEEILEDLE